MTVEIKELTINATLVKNAESAFSLTEERPPISDSEREEIIEACVEQVLKRLDQSKER